MSNSREAPPGEDDSSASPMRDQERRSIETVLFARLIDPTTYK